MSSANWEKFGVILPNGTILSCCYSGTTLEGEIKDGKWHVNGNIYSSPTTALIQNVVTREGYPTNLNGWKVWRVKRPSDNSFVMLSSLRAKSS